MASGVASADFEAPETDASPSCAAATRVKERAARRDVKASESGAYLPPHVAAASDWRVASRFVWGAGAGPDQIGLLTPTSTRYVSMFRAGSLGKRDSGLHVSVGPDEISNKLEDANKHEVLLHVSFRLTGQARQWNVVSLPDWGKQGWQ